MLAADMGLGKTVMGLRKLHQTITGGGRVLLVLSPGIISVWQAELKKYYKEDYETIAYRSHVISSKSSLTDIENKQLLYVTPSHLATLLGYQWTKKTAEQEHPLYKFFCGDEEVGIAPFKWPLVISDEAHLFRNSHKLYYAFRYVCNNAAKRLLITATPFHNSPYYELANYFELLRPTGTVMIKGKEFNLKALWNRNNFYELVDNTLVTSDIEDPADQSVSNEEQGSSEEEIDEDWFEDATNDTQVRNLVRQYKAWNIFPTLLDITKHSGLFVRMTKEQVSAQYAAIANKVYDRVILEPSPQQKQSIELLSELPTKNQLAIVTHNLSVNEDPATMTSIVESKTGQAWSSQSQKKARAIGESGTLMERSPKAKWICDNLESLLDLPQTLEHEGPKQWSKVAIVTKRRTCMDNVIETIAQRLSELSVKYPVLHKSSIFKISGDTADVAKESQAFNDTDAPAVIVLMHDLGFGYNLETANKMVLCSVWWNPGQDRQVHDRIHRISSPFEEVHIIQLVIKDSLDERVLKIMDAKTTVIKEDCGDDYVLMHVFPSQREIFAELKKIRNKPAPSAKTLQAPTSKKRKRVEMELAEESSEEESSDEEEEDSAEDESSASESDVVESLKALLAKGKKVNLKKLEAKYLAKATALEKKEKRKRARGSCEQDGTCPPKKKQKLTK
jgi:SNF2 family DNA or RNA helicase